jgi:hypothetical protein
MLLPPPPQAVRDITGSLSGVNNSLIVPVLDSSLETLWPPSRADGDFMATAACTLDAPLGRYVCPGTTVLGSIRCVVGLPCLCPCRPASQCVAPPLVQLACM